MYKVTEMILEAAAIGEFATLNEWEFDRREDAECAFDRIAVSDKAEKAKESMKLPTWYVTFEKEETTIDIKRQDLYRDGAGSRYNC